jgi:hypothetical protein
MAGVARVAKTWARVGKGDPMTHDDHVGLLRAGVPEAGGL